MTTGILHWHLKFGLQSQMIEKDLKKTESFEHSVVLLLFYLL